MPSRSNNRLPLGRVQWLAGSVSQRMQGAATVASVTFLRLGRDRSFHTSPLPRSGRHRLSDALRAVKAALHEQRWGVGSLPSVVSRRLSMERARWSKMSPLSRRRLLRALPATGAAALFRPQLASSQHARVLSKPIPSTGEGLPVGGLGSWITFNVGNDTIARDACAQVIRAFFDSGGRLIDSSPMYGSSQKGIGDGLTKLKGPPSLFSADKVWISSGPRGPDQIEASRRFWGVPRFDLLQVHNLLSWEEHLRTLLAMKAAGRLRYVGITTSEGRRHGEVERIMRAQPLDFVQVTYNILDREVEDRILPLARDRGIGV